MRGNSGPVEDGNCYLTAAILLRPKPYADQNLTFADKTPKPVGELNRKTANAWQTR